MTQILWLIKSYVSKCSTNIYQDIRINRSWQSSYTQRQYKTINLKLYCNQNNLAQLGHFVPICITSDLISWDDSSHETICLITENQYTQYLYLIKKRTVRKRICLSMQLRTYCPNTCIISDKITSWDSLSHETICLQGNWDTHYLIRQVVNINVTQ